MFQREKDFLGHNYFLINLIKHHIRKDSSKHFQKIRHLNIGRSMTARIYMYIHAMCYLYLLFTRLIVSLYHLWL